LSPILPTQAPERKNWIGLRFEKTGRISKSEWKELPEIRRWSHLKGIQGIQDCIERRSMNGEKVGEI
jgi:hypothetical protein